MKLTAKQTLAEVSLCGSSTHWPVEFPLSWNPEWPLTSPPPSHSLRRVLCMAAGFGLLKTQYLCHLWQECVHCEGWPERHSTAQINICTNKWQFLCGKNILIQPPLKINMPIKQIRKGRGGKKSGEVPKSYSPATAIGQRPFNLGKPFT